MEPQSLVDRYCPDVHGTAITAAAFDPQSSARVTADAWGVVAITRPGDKTPTFVFQPGVAIHGAVDISPGGALVAVGDDAGSITIYKTWDGSCVFEDHREGAEGAARAMRAMAFHPDGTQLATLSVDGIIRLFDIQRWERVANWRGFAGDSLQFDEEGNRLLAIDTLGQPKLLDLETYEQVDLELVPGGAQIARFTPDTRHVVTMGAGGISLIDLPSGRILHSFTAQGSSGMLNLVVSPGGDQVAAITQRSVHRFSLPALQPIASERHGAESPSNAVLWDWRSVEVPDHAGTMHRPGARSSLEPITCCSGFGDHRVAVHGNHIAVWAQNRQRRPFNAKHHFVEVKIDRDGRLVCGLPDDNLGIQVYEAKTGRHLFEGGPDTANTTAMEIGGPIVAAMLNRGGLRWWDLKNNSLFELEWVRHFALSGGGTWLGCVTPKGHVHVLDPATGEDAIPAPLPLSDVPVSLVSFVNRRPDMLVMDEDGVLSVYDLAVSVTEGRPARGQDILDLNVAVDRLWGITGGRHAAVRFQDYENERATIIFVDLEQAKVVSEVGDLQPWAWVDPENGTILQPARGAAIQELTREGEECRILRALPEGEWIAFGPEGIFDRSTGAEV